MYHKREISDKAFELLKSFKVLCLIGPRQACKSSLHRNVFSDFEYLSLEDLDNNQFASEDPRGFLLSTNKSLIIDEAQKSPKLFSYLQGIVDDSNNDRKFILSGSQNFL